MQSFPFLLCFLFSFCSMTYEYVIAKVITDLADNLLVWHSLTIGCYLCGVGLGAFLFKRLAQQTLSAFLIHLEWALTAVALLAIPYLWVAHFYYRTFIADYQAVNALGIRSLDMVLASYQMLPLMLGLLAGLELRAVMALFPLQLARQQWGRFWWACNSGGLLACVLYSLVFYSRFTPYQLLLATSLGNLGLGLWLAGRQQPPAGGGGGWQRLRPAVVLAALWLAAFASQGWLEQVHLKNFYYNHLQAGATSQGIVSAGPLARTLSWRAFLGLPAIQRQQSRYQVIDFVSLLPSGGVNPQEVIPGGEAPYALYLNGHFQFAANNERYYHEAMAHVPLMVLPPRGGFFPRDILVVGGGDGLLVRELLRYRHLLTTLTLVELDEELLKLAQQPPLSRLNEGALADPLVNLVVGDGLAWLRFAHSRFDAIYLDLPYPSDADSLRLYTVEFLGLVHRHLRPGSGFVVLDAPLSLRGNELAQIHTRQLLAGTFVAAGFTSLLAFERRGEAFLLATPTPRSFSLAYRDLGSALLTLSPQNFDQELAFRRLASEQKAESRLPANSLFKAQHLTFKDLRL